MPSAFSSDEIILAERPCPLTARREAVVVAQRDRHGKALRNVLSLGSGLIYVDPRPVDDLGAFYREHYRVAYKRTYEPKPKHIFRAGRVALDRLEHSQHAARAGMRCLDIGAGGGEWVYLLKRLGCESIGIEPNTGYGSFAKDRYGVEVHLGLYQEARLEPGSFDLVSLYQVLEHLSDPVEDLCRMAGFLREGGLFLIEVPDILFPGMRFRHKWHEGHLYGFDALTLEAVAAQAGLRKRFIKVLPGNLFGVFEKCGEGPSSPDLKGHAERVAAALQEGRKQYWRRPDTYSKMPRRFVRQIEELWSGVRDREPNHILDRLYGEFA